MKIIYSPFYIGSYYMENARISMDVQVVETQGLLSQLALHAGIHQQIAPYPERLTSYHKALLEYDKAKNDNIFHRSIEIDSMRVAKTLLGWRDNLALCGWNKDTKLANCSRLNALAEIDSHFCEGSLADLMKKLMDQVCKMKLEEVRIPNAYNDLTIEIPCSMNLLPDYIQPLLKDLQSIGVRIEENVDNADGKPKSIKEIHFSQQWKAEVWLSQQHKEDYDVWINTNNKRLDNWLHASGKPVCGSEMRSTNPQITQMFLLAVQLFQRPLNVNTLLQYLLLPECPLHYKLARPLAKCIIREGGFCNENVQKCINDYIEKELEKDEDAAKRKYRQEDREENYRTYLPFDLRKDMTLAEETDDLDVKSLKKFLEKISNHASSRATHIAGVSPYDARIAQLRNVAEMTNALIEQLPTEKIEFSKLIQWAQSLYEEGDYTLYQAQVGSWNAIERPSNMIGQAEKTIWCDFYGDEAAKLSTDYLSNNEMEKLRNQGVLLWDKEHEKELLNLMSARPIHKTTEVLTIVTCDKQGSTKLSKHPLYLQLPSEPEVVDGDALYNALATEDVVAVDNHRESDGEMIAFDAKKHPVSWRNEESFSALESLLQNPLDYFMKYTLDFTEANETEIKMSLTNGNVAHETIETLFTDDRDGVSLSDYVANNYDQAFSNALLKKGALLLLPEHHLDKERLKYQLKGCVKKLAFTIEQNKLTVVACEQKEVHDLGFEGKITLQGYIDMLLKDEKGDDVVFDLKWTSKKDKFKTKLEENRAMQLAIYEAMLIKSKEEKKEKPRNVRTAYFVMPIGKLFSTDDFFVMPTGKPFSTDEFEVSDYYEHVTPKTAADIMDQLRNGYAERVKEINEGEIETADNVPIIDIKYAQTANVYPLEDNGRKREPRKEENIYSDYKCFTI